MKKYYIRSVYNENTNEQIDYYINEKSCNIGDNAYLYLHESKKLIKMKIIKVVCRSNDPQYYNSLTDDILLKKEILYKADTSAEFITDKDSYLVWFKYC